MNIVERSILINREREMRIGDDDDARRQALAAEYGITLERLRWIVGLHLMTAGTNMGCPCWECQHTADGDGYCPECQTEYPCLPAQRRDEWMNYVRA